MYGRFAPPPELWELDGVQECCGETAYRPYDHMPQPKLQGGLAKAAYCRPAELLIASAVAEPANDAAQALAT